MDLTDASWATVRWDEAGLSVLDQTLLPGEVRMIRLETVDAVVDAIGRLAVRGAPALGVAGAYGVVVGLDELGTTDRTLDSVARRVGDARPTAVNLRRGVDRTVAAARRGGRPAALAQAHAVAAEDREACRLIGEHGRVELAAYTRLLTHCNAGRLATSGIGTALAPMYAKHAAGDPVEVLAAETRPLLQGARLTAWELADAGIPVTLLADTAVGAALALSRVDAVVVGCDRVAANGDVANKIGTYAVAVLAAESGVPFYVAGPLSTFDPATPDGASIVVEQRDGDEVRTLAGQPMSARVPVWNPAFDVTPARLVTGFLTEAGVLRPPYGPAIVAALSPRER